MTTTICQDAVAALPDVQAMLTLPCLQFLDRISPGWNADNVLASGLLLQFVSEKVAAIILSTRIATFITRPPYIKTLEQYALRNPSFAKILSDAKSVSRSFGHCSDKDIVDMSSKCWQTLFDMSTNDSHAAKTVDPSLTAMDKTISTMTAAAVSASITATVCTQVAQKLRLFAGTPCDTIRHVMMTKLFQDSSVASHHTIHNALERVRVIFEQIGDATRLQALGRLTAKRTVVPDADGTAKRSRTDAAAGPSESESESESESDADVDVEAESNAASSTERAKQTSRPAQFDDYPQVEVFERIKPEHKVFQAATTFEPVISRRPRSKAFSVSRIFPRQ
jgi:hypothetical protein